MRRNVEYAGCLQVYGLLARARRTANAVTSAALAMPARYVGRFALGVCILLGGWGHAEEQTKTLTQSEMEALVQNLGNDDFPAREEAFLALAAQGENAREVLTRAIKLEDLEIVIRAERLIYLIDCATVVVRAVDSSGKAIAGETINLTFQRKRSEMKPEASSVRRGVPSKSERKIIRRELVTGQDGTVSVGEFDPDVLWTLSFECAAMNYLPIRERHQDQCLKPGKQEFQLKLLRPGKINGVFIDEDRQPLAGLEAYLVPHKKLASFDGKAASKRGIQSATTDKRGRFSFERLSPEGYVVLLLDGDGVRFKSEVLNLSAEQELALEPLVLSTKHGDSTNKSLPHQ